jgi:hypothetical protein
MKKIYLNRALLFSLIILTFLTPSCTGKELTGKASSEDGNASENTEADENKVKPDSRPDSKDVHGNAEVTEPEGTDFLLFTEFKADPVISADFEIGKLQSGFENEGITADILSTADAFLMSVVNGKVNTKLIASEKMSFVQRMMTDGLEISGPTAYRIGEINTVSEPSWAKVRMFSGKGWSSGILYFIREGGWKIYDFHLDFYELEKSAPTEIGNWDPDDRKKVKDIYGKYN